MTNEERDIIAKFIARVGGQPQQASAWGGSAPAAAPQLPPVDREADQFIGQQFQQHPEAPYRITQMALVQEAALVEAQNRMQRMQWEIEQMRNAAQQAQQQVQAQPQQSRGILGSLFGGGQQQQAQPGGNPYAGYRPTTPPPQPQYPPQYQPGMFQRGGIGGGGGSGFLGTALAGATGVAGGMLLGNALTGMFSGHHGGAGDLAQTASDSSGGVFGGMFGGSGSGSGGAFDSAGTTNVSDPTAGFADAGSDPWASGGADKGFSNDTSFDNSGGGGGFDQGGGSFDQGGGGGDSFGSAGGFDDQT